MRARELQAKDAVTMEHIELAVKREASALQGATSRSGVLVTGSRTVLTTGS